MLGLEELIIKLSVFFIIAYLFIFIEMLVLSFIEGFPLNKECFNIFNYYPLSYGVLLPIFLFLCSVPYYPIGTSRYTSFPLGFEVEHTASKLFSFCFLVFLFFISLSLLVEYYYFIPSTIFPYIFWCIEVFLIFLIFQLIPFYPSLMGLALLKEIKKVIIKKRKLIYLPILETVKEFSIIMYMSSAIFIHFIFLNEYIQYFIQYFTSIIYTEITLSILLCLIIIMISILYIKKREYNEYLSYIKYLLKDAILKEQDSKK